MLSDKQLLLFPFWEPEMGSWSQLETDRQGFLSHPRLMLHFGDSYKPLLSQLPVKRVHCSLLPWQRSPEPVARWGQGQVGWMLSSGKDGCQALVNLPA